MPPCSDAYFPKPNGPPWPRAIGSCLERQIGAPNDGASHAGCTDQVIKPYFDARCDE